MRDSLVVTGPHLHQETLGDLLVTPLGGAQGRLKDLLGGGGNSSTASAVDGIVAHAGGGQVGATPLKAAINRVAVVDNDGDSVLLPPAAPGLQVTVIQAGYAALSVYPGAGDSIRDASQFAIPIPVVNAPFVMPSGSMAVFASAKGGEWSVLLGVASGPVLQSVQDNIVAVVRPPDGSGSYPPPGTPTLAAGINRVSQVATAGYGVFLPPSYQSVGASCLVVNDGLLPCQVWGSPVYESDDTVQSVEGATGIPLAPGASALFFCPRITEWAAVMAGGAVAPLQPLPLGFVLPTVGANAALYLPMAIPCDIPAGLVGTVVMSVTPPTADATFRLMQYSPGNGSFEGFGSIRIPAGASYGAVLQSPSGASFAAGDVLALVLPTDLDDTLADVGITVLAFKRPTEIPD